MADICVIEDKGKYYKISEFDSETEDFNSIFFKIENALKEKMQDIVFSLSSIRVLYSSHLAVFVRINQILRKNNLRFVLTDISPEIKNLLQITQLDNIFPVYKTFEDFQNSDITNKPDLETDFEWQIVKDNENSANVMCKGNMTESETFDELQKNIMDFQNISFDFSKLQSMDAAAIAFFKKMASENSVKITGANEELAKQLCLA